tara:strand:- start:1 stop:147 length:147 start_codon:yes stop_codon:yes gene_type:complete
VWREEREKREKALIDEGFGGFNYPLVGSPYIFAKKFEKANFHEFCICI